MKHFLFIFFYLLLWQVGFSQNDSAGQPLKDSIPKIQTNKPVVKPSLPRVKKVPKPAADTIKLIDSVTPRTIQSPVLISDSVIQDTARVDSFLQLPVVVVPKKFTGIDSAYAHFLQNPYLPVNAKPVYQILKFRDRKTKDELFYHIVVLVFILALIRIIFSRYIQNIFGLFFQPSFKQKQTREQLMQNNLASFMLNIFFLISGGTYVALLAKYYDVLDIGFWTLFFYSTLLLLILYLGKFLLLTFSGWVFNVKEAAATYIFVVNVINKIIGILLLPFIVIVAFSQQSVIEVSITISVLLIILLFVYRFIVSYAPVHRELKVSPLHLFIYVIAFEIVPLLFIYKTLMLFLVRTL